MLNSPDDWYNRQEPTSKQIQETWVETSKKAKSEILRWIPGKSAANAHAVAESPLMSFVRKNKPEYFHASIKTANAIREEEEEILYRTEMPHFWQDDELSQEEEDELDSAEMDEESRIAMDERHLLITDQSVLVLNMEIRRAQLAVVTAGITHQRYDSIVIPPAMSMKIVEQVSSRHRKLLADILLFQLAETIAGKEFDEEDAWQDLPTIIDTHLDMPNMRAFHRLISGAEE